MDLILDGMATKSGQRSVGRPMARWVDDINRFAGKSWITKEEWRKREGTLCPAVGR